MAYMTSLGSIPSSYQSALYGTDLGPGKSPEDTECQTC